MLNDVTVEAASIEKKGSRSAESGQRATQEPKEIDDHDDSARIALASLSGRRTYAHRKINVETLLVVPPPGKRSRAKFKAGSTTVRTFHARLLPYADPISLCPRLVPISSPANAGIPSEAGIAIEVPASQGAYDRQADKLLQDVILACRERSAELADFVLLGGIAAIDTSLRFSEEPVIDDLRQTATDVLARHNLDGNELYDRFLAYVHKSDDEAKEEGLTSVRINTFLTPAMDPLTGALEPLEADSSISSWRCRLSPPMKVFRVLYRPLASALDCPKGFPECGAVCWVKRTSPAGACHYAGGQDRYRRSQRCESKCAL